MPPKRNERGKKNRKAKANVSATSQQQATVVSKRSPPTRRAKSKAGRAVKKTVTTAPSNNNKPLVSVGKRKSRKADPIFFTADSGIQYRIGDYAYVDAERSDLPFHICRIRDLKTTRKEHVVADVTWFYRPSEVPESIYLHLLDDQQDEYGDVFKDKRIRERQLFISLSCLDLRPLEASLFRGKCEVFQLTKETQLDLETLFDTKDQFFYSLAYNQESRQFTFVDKEGVYSCPYIPLSQQAELPELRDFPAEYKENCQLVWEPKIDDEQLLTCLRAARSIALHAGLWVNGSIQDGYLAASSDQTTQTVFDTLHNHDYKSDEVLTELVKKPKAHNIISKKQWGHDELTLFGQGVRQYGKHFSRIQKEYLPNRNICEMIEFYYHWKKTPVGLETRGIRKQKKQHHIKTARQYYLSQQDSGQEFADVCSAEEDEGSEEAERDMSYYICAHCTTKESAGWHHAGPKKYLLCDSCRLYFNKYGEMRPLKEQTDSADSTYKSYCQVPQSTNSKTRQATKKSPSPERGGGPTLRSGRVCKPSDTSEESTEEDYDDSGEEEDAQEMNDEMEPEDNEESDYSEDSYSNSHLPPIKKQPCRSASLLVHLRDKETDNMTEPPIKRTKLDTSGHSIEESGQTSNNQISSMSSSPAADVSSAPDQDTGHTSSHNSAHLPTPDSDLPLDASRFARIPPSGSDDSVCARSNIVYIASKRKTGAESEGAGSSSSTGKAAKPPQTPLASTPSMQHTPLISVYTPTMTIPPTTPFIYPPMIPAAAAGELYNREQAAAMGLQFQRPGVPLFEQERMQELQRMMYHKQQQQQQQHGMQIEGHMMSPAMAQHHQYFQGMVAAYPEMMNAVAAAAAAGNNEEVLIRQRMMAAAAASQVAPQTPNADLNHFQFDPRVLMQYGAMHNQEEAYMMIRQLEMKLVQFTQQIVLHQPSMLQPEFATELQKHYEIFRYLLLQNPTNQHNPTYLQIWQVLEHCMQQQRAAAMEHPVRTGVIVNSNH